MIVKTATPEKIDPRRKQLDIQQRLQEIARTLRGISPQTTLYRKKAEERQKLYEESKKYPTLEFKTELERHPCLKDSYTIEKPQSFITAPINAIRKTEKYSIFAPIQIPSHTWQRLKEANEKR